MNARSSREHTRARAEISCKVAASSPIERASDYRRRPGYRFTRPVTFLMSKLVPVLDESTPTGRIGSSYSTASHPVTTSWGLPSRTP
ncbi:hypothetical protein MTO96_016136 [Rhipicephalus appendiculatus]